VREGFEPSKAEPPDLQSGPFGHSGTSPKNRTWSWRWDSNPRPADYKSAALPAELRQHTPNTITAYFKSFLSTFELKTSEKKQIFPFN
jgi:hypothetical protein